MLLTAALVLLASCADGKGKHEWQRMEGWDDAYLCNIERRPMISTAEEIAEVMSAGEPIIFSLSDEWKNVAEMWSKDSLMEESLAVESQVKLRVGKYSEIDEHYKGIKPKPATTGLTDFLIGMEYIESDGDMLFDLKEFCDCYEKYCQKQLHLIPGEWLHAMNGLFQRHSATLSF